MTRLETLSPRLAALLRRAPREQLHAACLAACEFAVRRTRVESRVVDEALQKLRRLEPLTPELKASLDELSSRLDGEYFDLREAVEDGLPAAGDPMCPFEQARAVAALSFAADANSRKAASEVIYEAASSTGDHKELVEELSILLRSTPPGAS